MQKLQVQLAVGRLAMSDWRATFLERKRFLWDVGARYELQLNGQGNAALGRRESEWHAATARELLM